MSQTTSLLPEPKRSTQVASNYLRLIRLHNMPGYLPGLRQPVVVAEFQLLSAAPHDLLEVFMGVVERAFGPPPVLDEYPEFKRWPVVAYIARATLGVLQRAEWPMLDKLTIFKQDAASKDRVMLAFPSFQLADSGVRMVLQGVMELLQALATRKEEMPAEDVISGLRQLLPRLQSMTPNGINTLRFLEAAHAQGIPWKRLANNVFQYGWGARARWLDSSFTDLTPTISVRVSRDKRAAAVLLRQAGVPVPDHGTARTEAQALRIAERLGYPVVVKPANLDGGKGVAAYLTSPAEVTKAFAAASRLSGEIMVEKHFVGNDYRVQVFNGEVYWVVHRMPAGVVGDGTHNVRELLAITNADPRRGGPESALLKWIVVDEEANTWLVRQALSLDAVPEAGRFVRLRGAANVASGGTIEPVLDIAHPDNLALAARAAKVLRLDIAGIDLLIPDIRQSWLQTGAVICEVNAQPQMSPHLPAQLLPQLVTRQGRIPVVLLVGGEAPAARLVLDGLAMARAGSGIASKQGVWISGHQVAARPMTSFDAAQCLLVDPAVTLLAMHAEKDLLQSGCPVDSIDHLVLAGPLQKNAQAEWPATLGLAGWLASMSRKVWLLDAAPQWQQLQTQQPGLAFESTEAQLLLDHLIQSFAD